MITVHHLENSRSQRILWMLEELGMPYDVEFYKRAPTLAAPDALKKIHPLGKSPVIEDDGRVVAETGAIVEYLVEKAEGKLGAPADMDGKLRYRYFLHYAEGSVMTNLLMLMVMRRVPLIGKSASKKMAPLLTVHLDYIEAELAGRDWFAGDVFTAADVMMSFPLEFAAESFNALESRPATAAWLEKIHARPCWKTALEKGGPYRFA